MKKSTFRSADIWRQARPRLAGVLLVTAVLAFGPAAGAKADDAVDKLALTLIDRFYDDLAPDNTALAGFLGDGFQIIGSDGLRFDRDTYLAFPKKVTSYEISDLVTRRDGNVLTTTFEVGYKGEFEGVSRDVPHLARMAVFHETADGWKLQAFAALGTGENAVDTIAADVVAKWQAAVASGDSEAIRALAAPDFQIQRPNGGAALDDYLQGELTALEPAMIEDLVATSFSNTMVTRYVLLVADRRLPRLTVFERINGKWLAAADAVFAVTE